MFHKFVQWVDHLFLCTENRFLQALLQCITADCVSGIKPAIVSQYIVKFFSGSLKVSLKKKKNRVPVISRFLAKTLRVNKPAMKNFLKNLSLGVDVKLYVPPLTYKINAHNISGVRSNLNWRIVMANYVWMCVCPGMWTRA